MRREKGLLSGCRTSLQARARGGEGRGGITLLRVQERHSKPGFCQVRVEIQG